MRIILIGNVEFSEKILKKLVALKADIVGVVTAKQSKFNADFCDLGKICRKNGIECRYVVSINEPEHVRWIAEQRPDIIFCFGFSQLLNKEILRIPTLGAIGYHPAGLPQNRGRHPIVWALALGLKETASTFFFMDEGADRGDILIQLKIVITYQDDVGTLYDKIIKVALKQVADFLPRLESGRIRRIKQNSSKANYWRKRGKEDGRIDFRMNSGTIYNLARALTKPYVGAYVNYRGQEIKIWRVKEDRSAQKNQEFGKVLNVQGLEIFVKCSDGAVCLREHGFKKLPKPGEYIL